jgi:formylglycine-generating enzyme required for sulfatase activity
MIEQTIAILQQAGFDLTARELAEIIWLAVHLDASEQPQPQPATNKQPVTNQPPTTNNQPPTTNNQPRENSADIYLPSSVKHLTTATESREAIPIKVPAAVALRNSLALGRSLRPLMRKVPSPTEKILDEEATVRRIADEKVWMPVVKSAPQRWLELALVVEQTSSTAIWQQTINELQQLLKHHGAFRDVRTWGLKITEAKTQIFVQNRTGNFDSKPRSPKELIDSKGRRLILLVSDCISPAWRNKFIHPVLNLWGTQGLLTILQLLPEHLWERTALASEISLQLHSLSPGVFNSQLIGKTWDDNDIKFPLPESPSITKEHNKKIQNSISVPIVTLEPEPLLTWAKVIAGLGKVGTVGFIFTPSTRDGEADFSEVAGERLHPTGLVSRFRATASPLARRLAVLMAAAPVSLPVVHLIQQTVLKDSRQIHVAEVFMSGLLKPQSSPSQDTRPNYIEYEFIDEIRELLLDSIRVSEANLVLEKVSEFVARRVGLSVKDFEARLLAPTSSGNDTLETQIRPFARLKAQVLRQLGGVYALKAAELEVNSQALLKFTFEVVTVNRRGEIIKKETKQAQFFSVNLGKDIPLEMVFIAGGSFMMGSPEGEGNESEKPQHKVNVQPFFMGKYPITQAQWRAVAKLPQVERKLKSEPSHFKGDDLPVESISWYDAVEFCARLSKETRREYRLPTEAEWEYGCRAGTTTPFHFGETITSELANYDGNLKFSDEAKGERRRKTTSIGHFPANSFGLYDMHGNVWEWCEDTWHGNYKDAATDGSARTSLDDNNNQKDRLLRGGSWFYNPGRCRSAYRNSNSGDGGSDIGFRIVCVVAARN